HGGAAPAPMELKLPVEDPEGEARETACKRCDGEWISGMVGIPFCNCKTSDVGKVCHDGKDCEGYCIHTDFEVVKTETELCPPGRRCVPVVYEWVIPVGT